MTVYRDRQTREREHTPMLARSPPLSFAPDQDKPPLAQFQWSGPSDVPDYENEVEVKCLKPGCQMQKGCKRNAGCPGCLAIYRK